MYWMLGTDGLYYTLHHWARDIQFILRILFKWSCINSSSILLGQCSDLSFYQTLLVFHDVHSITQSKGEGITTLQHQNYFSVPLIFSKKQMVLELTLHSRLKLRSNTELINMHSFLSVFYHFYRILFFYSLNKIYSWLVFF